MKDYGKIITGKKRLAANGQKCLPAAEENTRSF